jgi:hypothetical protein
MKLKSLSLVLGLTVGCMALAMPAMAQYTEDRQANPLADFQTDNSDPFSGRGNSAGSMMNLMNRMMLGTPDAENFNALQQDNMNDAMSSFRAKQMQRLKEQQVAAQANNSVQTSSPELTAQPSGVVMPAATTQPGALMLTPMQWKPLQLNPSVLPLQ